MKKNKSVKEIIWGDQEILKDDGIEKLLALKMPEGTSPEIEDAVHLVKHILMNLHNTDAFEFNKTKLWADIMHRFLMKHELENGKTCLVDSKMSAVDWFELVLEEMTFIERLINGKFIKAKK